MTTLGVRLVFNPKAMRLLFREQYRPVARAATAAVTEAGHYVRFVGGLDIGAAGFSERWQQALSFKVFPKDKGGATRGRGSGPDAIDAAAFIYHRIPYANVFEEGASIKGRPFLWLPLPAAQRFARGGRKITPQSMPSSVKLTPVRRPGKPPLLVGYAPGIAPRGARGALANVKVPMFVGVDQVDVSKKFHIRDIAEAARKKLPAYYTAAFEDKR